MFRFILQHPTNLLVKVLSLSAGLLIGIILFSTVAFDSSYEGFLPDADRIYRLHISVSQNNSTDGESLALPTGVTVSSSVLAGMAPLLAQTYPSIEQGTTAYRPGNHQLVFDERSYSAKILYADSCWFNVLQFRIIQGDANELAQENNILLSQTLAHTIFKDNDPIGKTVMYNKTVPYTVIGVFEDVPENCHLQYDAVGSFINMERQFGFYTGWKGGDSFLGYIKAAKGTDPRDLDSKDIENLFYEQGFDFLQNQGVNVAYSFVPLQDIYQSDPAVRTRMITFSLLGIILLLICSLNYVLLSLSALERRSKTIAVRKTSGAGKLDIFCLFLAENGVVVLISTLVAVMGLLALREPVSELTGVTLRSLFTWQRLWVPLCVMAAVFALGGLIPAHIYCRVPITYAFRTASPSNRLWKHCLLALQLAGATFTILLLTVVIRQYNLLTRKDLGYDYDQVVSFKIDNLTPNRLQNALSTLEAAPFIEAAGYSNHLPIDHMYGMPVEDPQTQDIMFVSRRMYCSANYFSAMGFRLSEGDFFTEDTPTDEVLVNETFVQTRHWEGSPIGQTISFQEQMPLVVKGVVKDFHIASLRESQTPLIICNMPIEEAPGTLLLSVKLKNFSQDYLSQTFDLLTRLFPDQVIQIRPYNALVLSQYEKENSFRHTVALTCTAAWIIALTGLIAFLASETRRRRKEMALRRINGATRHQIFLLNSNNHIYMTLAGLGAGIVAADVTSRIWLAQFAIKTDLPWWLFLGAALIVGALLLSAFYIQSIHISRENPATILHNN